MRQVTANPAGLFLIIANAGNTPVTWRDLHAAGRAWMRASDPQPLLRLMAEARDSYSGGGASKDFGVGLEDAVACAEYGNYFNLSDSISARLREFQHKLAVSAPSAFPTMAGPR